MLGHQYSATGGQLDFVRGAYASRGGKSIIACHSTAAKGKVSRIVARLEGPTTTPRMGYNFSIAGVWGHVGDAVEDIRLHAARLRVP